MKLRCDLHVNGDSRKLVLVPGPHETAEHLGLKLAAYLLFWDDEPVMSPSAGHPALASQEFIPDLMALDETGGARLWVECGRVTMHKMGKLVRRHPGARLVVIKPTEAEAARLRRDLDDQVERSGRVEVWGWPAASFREWMAALGERTEVFGEAYGRALNVVINERPFVCDLIAV